MKKLAGGCAATIIATPVLVAVAFMALQPELFAAVIWRMFWTFCALCGLVIAVLIAVLRNRRERRDRTFRDGSLPVIRRTIRRWCKNEPWPVALWYFLQGELQHLDPNLEPAGFILRPDGEIVRQEPAEGWPMRQQIFALVQNTHHLQAVYPGDTARENMFGRDSLMPRMPAQRAFANKIDRLALPEPDDEIDGEFAPVVEPLRLTDALSQSTPQKWLLGQDDTGQTVAFDPATQQNLGIVGATGTGKTTGSGFHALLLALKFGWHPVILDPKGGADLSRFDVHCEWNATDADIFGEQMALIRREHDRRAAILRDHQAPNIDALRTKELPHILVFCEEYGDMWEQIAATKKQKEIARIDHDIDSMMRMSRMTGIHFCFVDQFPEKWSQQVFSATKMRLVYQVAPGQDSYLREYKADTLPDRGAFMYRRQIWQPWHVAPELRRLLFDAPISGYPRLIEGATVPSRSPEAVPDACSAPVPLPVPMASPEVDHPDPEAGNGYKWEAFVRDWRRNNPNGGPSALARAMRDADGNVKPHTSYKSEAARRLDALGVAPTGLDQLHTLGIDLSSVRLSNGERLGTDISYAMGDD